MKVRSRSASETKMRRWERIIELASEAGAIAMALRDRPTHLDWLAVGMRSLGLALQVRAHRRKAAAASPWSFFVEEGPEAEWRAIPDALSEVVLEHVRNARIVESHWDGDTNSSKVCLGSIDNESIGWIEDSDGDLSSGPYVLIARERETFEAIGARLWRQFPSGHVTYTKSGLIADKFGGNDILPTQQLMDLRRRMELFLEHDLPRSYLLAGPPGTGKSSGIHYLTSVLGLRSVRVDLNVFSGNSGYNSDARVAASLTTLIKLLSPEAMILDDIDRVSVGGELLHFLEFASRSCKVVLASANCPERMIAAALRPGRFDELVRVEALDPKVLRRMLTPDLDLFERMRAMPAAYVAEFIKRRRVLGRECAISELGELESRLKLCGEGRDDDDDDDQ